MPTDSTKTAPNDGVTWTVLKGTAANSVTNPVSVAAKNSAFTLANTDLTEGSFYSVSVSHADFTAPAIDF